MKELTIGQNDSKQRLDKFLKKLLVHASISHIYKLNRKWNIKINKKKKKIDYSLEIWDIVRIFISDSEYNELTKSIWKKIQNNENNILSKKCIIYEDKDILVLNKDPGVIVHPGDFKTTDLSLIEQVHDYVWENGWGHTFSPSLVHRIDKETSGIVLVAKQKQLLTQLVSDFKNHKNIKKTYFVMVIWKMSRTTWTIKKKLKRIENAQEQDKVQVSEQWQEAISHYELIQEYNYTSSSDTLCFSTLKVQIETGRMHQIRVHLASLGNPVVWDSKYGNKKINSFCKRNLWVERQMLHAWEIEIYNSLQKKHMKFTAPLKQDMKHTIKKLELWL